MCFSPTASFVAGISLCAVGIATLKRTKKSIEWPFALIPMLFGIQQLTEGILWMTFQHDLPLVRLTTTYLYSGFSHVLWTMYVPFATIAMETVPWRRRAIIVFQAIGVSLGLYLLFILATRPLFAEVVGRHIVYVSPHFYKLPMIYKLPMMAFYLIATCISCLFSSHGFIRLFGLLALISFFAAYFVNVLALFSIWCFMVAILSLVIYFHFRFRNSPERPSHMGVSRSVLKSFNSPMNESPLKKTIKEERGPT